jgi:outer membrane murein-binding lipoprotein Lpp
MLLLMGLFLLSGCGGNAGNNDVQGRVTELETENEALRTENEALEQRVATLEEEISELQDQDTEISRKPNEGWEQFFPDAQTTTLTGESTEAVRALLGNPPVLIRQTAVVPEASREIWVYMPLDEDPTGLYLFFKGNQLDSSRQDEFNGLYGSGLLDLEEFWLQ